MVHLRPQQQQQQQQADTEKVLIYLSDHISHHADCVSYLLVSINNRQSSHRATSFFCC
jgi:hypothetical protein